MAKLENADKFSYDKEQSRWNDSTHLI